jgi:hypothetical protein
MQQQTHLDSNAKKIIDLIPFLVQLGRTADTSVIPASVLPNSLEFGVLWQKWDSVIHGWAANDVSDLIKGMTHFEKAFKCGFGSVPPVAQLFSIYVSMVDASESHKLAEWILLNTVNDYVPYGTSNHGARSLLALQRINESLKARKQATANDERARFEDAQRNKVQQATERLPKALRRKDASAVAALIAKGADIHAISDAGQSAYEIAKELGVESLLIVEITKAEK